MPSSKKKHRSVRVHFTHEEYKELETFLGLLNVTGKHFTMAKMCRQSVFYSINDSREKARSALIEELRKREADGVTPGGDTQGVSAEVSGSEAVSPSPLANTADGGTESASTGVSQPE